VRGDRGNPVPYRDCSGYPLYHYLHADGTLKATGIELIGTNATGKAAKSKPS
jgi:hypothetical protein